MIISRTPTCRLARVRLSILTCAFLLGAGATSGADESLTYVLTPQFGSGRLKVRLDWQTRGRTRSALRVSPSWGRVEDVPTLLKQVRFVGAKVRRKGPMWTLSHNKNALILVEYIVQPQVSSFDDWRHTHHPIVTDEFFHGMGNAFLMAPATGGGLPASYEVMLRWELPAGNKAVCSWGGVGRSVGARLKPTDLRHSVYLAGRLKTHSVQREDRRVTVAMIDRFDFDTERFGRITAAIIDEQCRFFDERDFPDFVVTAIPVGKKIAAEQTRLAGAGLFNSFALFLTPKSDLDDAFEHLFAHELLHYWNGRVLSAAEPERLVFWFVEGLTDYYALRILLDTKRWDARTFAKWINKHIRAYYTNSAIHATNTEINENFWSQRDTVGEIAYQRGLLLGLRWHRLARQHGVASGFDRLFLGLIERGRSGLRLTNAAIRRIGIEILGAWFGAEFDRYVVDADTVVLPRDALAPLFKSRKQEVFAFETGFDRQRSIELRKVRGLVPGSAAQRAGLRDADELVGWTLGTDPDQEVVIKVRRGERETTIRYFPRGAKISVVQFEPLHEQSPRSERNPE